MKCTVNSNCHCYQKIQICEIKTGSNFRSESLTMEQRIHLEKTKKQRNKKKTNKVTETKRATHCSFFRRMLIRFDLVYCVHAINTVARDKNNLKFSSFRSSSTVVLYFLNWYQKFYISNRGTLHPLPEDSKSNDCYWSSGLGLIFSSLEMQTLHLKVGVKVLISQNFHFFKTAVSRIKTAYIKKWIM